MADRQARDLRQNQIAYSVAVAVLAVLPLHKRNDGVAGGDQLQLGTAQATGEARCRLAKMEDAGGGGTDAAKIGLAEQGQLSL